MPIVHRTETDEFGAFKQCQAMDHLAIRVISVVVNPKTRLWHIFGQYEGTMNLDDLDQYRETLSN